MPLTTIPSEPALVIFKTPLLLYRVFSLLALIKIPLDFLFSRAIAPFWFFTIPFTSIPWLLVIVVLPSAFAINPSSLTPFEPSAVIVTSPEPKFFITEDASARTPPFEPYAVILIEPFSLLKELPVLRLSTLTRDLNKSSAPCMVVTEFPFIPAIIAPPVPAVTSAALRFTSFLARILPLTSMVPVPLLSIKDAYSG